MKTFTKTFKKIQQRTTTQTPIAQYAIDTTQIDQMMLGVFHNETGEFTAQVTCYCTQHQTGWNSDEVTLTNQLHKINNIAYKMPADFDFAEVWYDHVIARGREFKKFTCSDMHTKLGYRFNSRYHTIPYTWFSYDPKTELALLQMTIPEDVNGETDFFKNHIEVEVELDSVGARNFHYARVG